ncbi:MAG: SpoVR family protein [Gammaproteobacteria bacterium]|nr:SpoVR family protein [Gammaproteobacteria bacterium]
MSAYITESSEWDFPLLERYDAAIGLVARHFELDTYPNQLEVISAEQMMDAYSSVGMPVNYHHWSFGKQFLEVEGNYRRGRMGLAYEIVINSNPCIAYLMEENTSTMQALVIAHAAYGHNSFFKGNYLYQTWTSADAIVDYLIFARNYISECEQRYGTTEVEVVLDSCHALMNYGVDSYKRPPPLSAAAERERVRDREDYLQLQVNELWRTLPNNDRRAHDVAVHRFPLEPQENILYFIEKNAPLLEPWKREIVRIVRKMAQYFYPQRQTQVMNEGWATFWHYTILNRMYELGQVTDGFMIEFLQSHTNVVYQPGFDSPHFSGINPYTLGFSMMSDIRRICESPTDEDREWFPQLAGTPWRGGLEFAMHNFKDESFINQYLSPRLIRELKLFSVLDDDESPELEIAAIHDDAGYHTVRKRLAEQYELAKRQPNVQVYSVDRRGDRALTLRHFQVDRQPLSRETDEVLRHVGRLWGFAVRLEVVDSKDNVVGTHECPAQAEPVAA